MKQLIIITLSIVACGSVETAQAKAAIKAATDNKVADIWVDVILAGVKSGAVTAEAAAKQLTDMAAAAEEKAEKPATPVAAVTNTASDSGIIVSGSGNTINFVAPGSIVSGNGKKSSKAAAEDGGKKKMTSAESDAALESADHGVAVWYPKDSKAGKAIYKIDGKNAVIFDFSEPKEISDTVVEAVKELNGTVACNNPFVIKALGEGKGVFAANSKGSKMLKAVKALGDLMAAGDGAEGSGSGQATAPKGAAKPPKSGLGQKAAQRAAAAQAAAQQAAADSEELEAEEAPAQAV